MNKANYDEVTTQLFCSVVVVVVFVVVVVVVVFVVGVVFIVFVVFAQWLHSCNKVAVLHIFNLSR